MREMPVCQAEKATTDQRPHASPVQTAEERDKWQLETCTSSLPYCDVCQV